MNLQDILRNKGKLVYTVSPGATLAEVAQTLVQHNCGSLVVVERPRPDALPKMVGIITERDLLRACATHGGSLAGLQVNDFMSTNLVTGSPDQSVEHIMGVMTDHRVRHLPVLEEGELVGLISIGDVVKAHHHETAVENHYLKSYIQS